MPGSALSLIAGFYPAAQCRQIYQRLVTEQNWPDNHYLVAGRQFTLPRLQTWHADPGIVYSYSNNLLETRPWSPLLTELRQQLEGYLQAGFNAVLVNYYRDGDDYVGWHADDEPELGPQPLIASLSFGASRQFAYRQKKSARHGSLLLSDGSLLVMQPEFQHHWLHSVPGSAEPVGGRINLTFRKVLPGPATG